MRDYQHYLQRSRAAHVRAATQPYVNPYRDTTQDETPRPRWQRALFLGALMLTWCGGVLVLGVLYGTDQLWLALLALAASVLGAWFWVLWLHQSVASHTRTVMWHGLVMVLTPWAVAGVPSWWLQLFGVARPGCSVSAIGEFEVRGAPHYEHMMSCGNDVLWYESAGSPVAARGHTIDMLQDSFGWLAPMPMSAVPSWHAWITLGCVVVLLCTISAEAVRLVRGVAASIRER